MWQLPIEFFQTNENIIHLNRPLQLELCGCLASFIVIKLSFWTVQSSCIYVLFWTLRTLSTMFVCLSMYLYQRGNCGWKLDTGEVADIWGQLLPLSPPCRPDENFQLHIGSRTHVVFPGATMWQWATEFSFCCSQLSWIERERWTAWLISNFIGLLCSVESLDQDDQFVKLHLSPK